MITLYCRNKEGNHLLCDSSRELLAYAECRLDRCRYGEHKPSCRKCPVHCYRPDMRQRMLDVMRYAGPRMLLHHPFMALRHLWHEMRTHVVRQPSAHIYKRREM